MEETQIFFCELCVKKLNSETTRFIWSNFCQSAIEDDEFPSISSSDVLSNSVVRKIERAGLVTSIDHEDLVYVVPRGIFVIEDGFFVCCDIKDHSQYFQESVKENEKN